VRRRIAALLGTAVGLTASGTHAQDAACRSIANDAQRLACYDKAAGTASATMPGRPNEAAAAPVRAAPGATPAPIVVVEAAPRKDLDGALGARLTDRWELDPGQTRGTFLPRPYKPVYVLPLVHANAVNRQPTSGNPATSAATVAPLQSTEMEFQLSVKAKLAEGLLFGYGDVWAGYTQSSRWQVYNADLSRPFRETNYEPEAMLVFGTDYKLLGLHGRMLGLGINHQSNGRGQPLSRSWNRVIAMAGFEEGDWTLMFRPWWRIPESKGVDDNPDIANNLGRAEAVISKRWGRSLVSLQLRHSLRSGSNSRGSAELDWAFPIDGNLKGQVQLFSGYGESLIDYNFRQTRVGLGVSLVEWR
jgi:phospholipase A1